LQAHLKATQANAEPKLLKELAKLTQTKFFLKNAQHFEKNKKLKHTTDNQ